MATVMKDIVNWLKQWFYTESEVDTFVASLQSQINNKADTSTLNNKADKTNGASQITDASANTYTNISSSLTSTSTQADINSAINTKIGTLMGIDWIQVVQTLPTASAATMGKLYLVAISGSGDNNFKEYVTIENSGAYSWEKLGEISGSGLSVDWSDITNKPSTFSPSSHSHGDLSNDGKIGSNANKIITTGTGGVLQASGTIPATQVIDPNAHGNIGTNANTVQTGINVGIDTALGNKADKTAALGTTITLVDKGETNEGCIIFNTIS